MQTLQWEVTVTFKTEQCHDLKGIAKSSLRILGLEGSSAKSGRSKEVPKVGMTVACTRVAAEGMGQIHTVEIVKRKNLPGLGLSIGSKGEEGLRNAFRTLDPVAEGRTAPVPTGCIPRVPPYACGPDLMPSFFTRFANCSYFVVRLRF